MLMKIFEIISGNMCGRIKAAHQERLTAGSPSSGGVVGGLLVFALFATGCASTARHGAGALDVAARVDVGPVVTRDATLTDEDRVRGVGPFYESQASTNNLRFFAIRPFYSSVINPEAGQSLQEFLWPLATRRISDGQSSTRWLLAFGADRDLADAKSRERFWVFPFIYTGLDNDGSRYFAFWPFGGTIPHFMLRDRVSFVLWPIYCHSTVHDLEAHHVLWPFIGWTKGAEEHGYHVFPLYGEFVNEGRFTKRYVLWPFWTSVRYDYPRETGGGHVLFPIYGRVKTTKQEGWMVLPPFFRWSRGEKLTQANLPWPFVQYSKGEVDKFYLWPLWGRRDVGISHKTFFLWPFVRFDRVARSGGEMRRFHIVPFVYSDITDAPVVAGSTNAPGPALSRYFKFWPLWVYRREGDVASLRVLALWPSKQSGPIDRNYAPLWTLYSRERVGAARESELLWGLWRNRRGADGSRHLGLFPIFTRDWAAAEVDRRGGWSVLGGLFGREREGLIKRTRLLYFLTFESDVTGGTAKAESPETPPEAGQTRDATPTTTP